MLLPVTRGPSAAGITRSLPRTPIFKPRRSPSNSLLWFSGTLVAKEANLLPVGFAELFKPAPDLI